MCSAAVPLLVVHFGAFYAVSALLAVLTRSTVVSVFGTVLWVGGLVTLGYFFGNVPFIKKNLSLLVVAIILLSLVPMIIGVVRSRFGGAKVETH